MCFTKNPLLHLTLSLYACYLFIIQSISIWICEILLFCVVSCCASTWIGREFRHSCLVCRHDVCDCTATAVAHHHFPGEKESRGQVFCAREGGCSGKGSRISWRWGLQRVHQTVCIILELFLKITFKKRGGFNPQKNKRNYCVS